MVRLRKNYDATRNSRYAHQLGEDMQKIEDSLNENAADLTRHKESDNAHLSSQIKHGLFTVANQLDNLWSRVVNLVLNHDGDDVKEVVDTRVALDASIHKTVKDRLDYDFGLIISRLDRQPDINVLDLGADPTGKYESSFAIQAALDRAKKGKSIRVVVPPGAYRLGATLVNWGNTWFDAKGAYLLNYHGKTMMTNGDGTVEYLGYEGNGNIYIDGGTWDCRGTEFKTKNNCFSFGHGKNIFIRNSAFKDVSGYHAIEFNACQNFKVLDSDFYGFVDHDGSRYFSEAIQVDLAQRKEVFGAFGAYDFTTCKDGLIQGCNFGKSNTPGTQAWPRGVGSHSSTIGYWHENIRVKDCLFEDLEGWAVRGYNWNVTDIKDNTLRNCRFGITVSAIDPASKHHTLNNKFEQMSRSQIFRHVHVSGNTILNTRENEAIYIRGINDTGFVRNVNVQNNIIDGVGGKNQAGIRLDAVRNGIVSANQISNTSGDGVWMNDCVGVNVTGANQISFIGRDGIAAFGESTLLLIAGNNIRRPGRYGIEQSGVLISVIKDNLITGAGHSKHGAYEAIRIANKSKDILLAGNRCRSLSKLTKRARAGIYITNTVKGVVRYGNYCKGDWTISGIVDNSKDPKTDAKDVA
ncbi:right-handed parallel beta-helix repeat-containing protein [Bacillus altitudinis]|uniref:right-handed parallel beta-helix repeat-containing protein n=1 Tax=Bacillus altitudinis TaxID=293387 RepID=UPI0025A14460|nr:right-handed parallel beta-helix repeat-containing protein [Bacillus altitudinis]MDM5163819.1 right-handed parallel beta-helix repeat-containing protein [Bacillus altitudinis]